MKKKLMIYASFMSSFAMAISLNPEESEIQRLQREIGELKQQVDALRAQGDRAWMMYADAVRKKRAQLIALDSFNRGQRN